jgi:hypothetical protein
MGVNTWIPTSSRTVLVTLDASQYGTQFPRILLSSPSGIIDIVNSRATDTGDVISGNMLDCRQKPCELPSLGTPKSVSQSLGVARWMSAPGTPPEQAFDKLCITVTSQGATTLVTANGAIPTVQVISDTITPEWGSDAEVDIIEGSKMTKLVCEQTLGSRLICDAPDKNLGKDQMRPSLKLYVWDQHHSGGTPIKGVVLTQPCSNDDALSDHSCRKPLIWKFSPPKLVENTSNPPQFSDTKWNLWLELANIDAQKKAILGGFASAVRCNADPEQRCAAAFTFPISQIGAITNWMTLQIQDSGGRPVGGTSVITNILENMKPIITTITDDRKNWSGKNLVFEKIRVGSADVVSVRCQADGTQCFGDGSYAKAAGFMYFVVNDAIAFPFIQMNPSGSTSSVIYTPPKPAAAASPTNTFNLVIPPIANNSNALTDLKNKLGMQAVQ